MSKIEQAAKPAVKSLVLPGAVVLTPLHQRFLASFLCLVAIRTAVSSLGAGNAVSRDDISRLMASGEPGPHWSIWITRYVPTGPEDDFWIHYFGAQIGSAPFANHLVGPGNCNTQVTTVAHGHLYAHIFSSTQIPDIGYDGLDAAVIWPPYPFPIDTGRLPALDQKGGVWLHEAIARLSRDGTLKLG